MKKQIGYYVFWDVLFTVLLYAYCKICLLFRQSYFRGDNMYLSILISIFLLILIGSCIALLVFFDSKYQFSIKMAFSELIIIGGLALYLSTASVYPILVQNITGGVIIPHFPPVWIFYNSAPMIIGSVLLGYELFIFIIRIYKFKQTKNLSELE